MMHCGQQPGLSASFIPETSLPFLPHWGGDLAHSFERPPQMLDSGTAQLILS